MTTRVIFDGDLAVFSPDRRYRYMLKRQWSAYLAPCMFIMLNPSTADEVTNDPTVRRCIGFAKAWGHTELMVCNIFALRSTDPRALYESADPVGPDNHRHITEQADYVNHYGGPVVCAWGNHGALMGQGETVLGWLEGMGVVPMALRVTGAGQPNHPLYLSKKLQPNPLADLRGRR